MRQGIGLGFPVDEGDPVTFSETIDGHQPGPGEGSLDILLAVGDDA